MASAGKIFTDQDKKAFYTVQEEQEGGFSKCLGMCFRMNTTKGLFVWVSTSKTFKNSPNRIFAQRCIPSKKEGEQPLITPGITSEVHSNSGQNGSVSFIKCSGNENKNYLSFGFYNNLPNDISAYVFDEENIIELKFEKNSHSPEDYKLVSSPKTGLKVSRNFDLSRAVGAPVMKSNFKPARNQVVGILDVKTDGSLYPVFFKKKTFDLESKALLRQTDETVESENPITANSSCPEFEDQDKETNTAAPAGTKSGDQHGSDNLEATTKNIDKTDSPNGISESAAKGGPITQETEKPKKDKKLSLDDNLETLWDNPFFQDELCKALDLVHLHSELKDHRHVADKFDIPADVQKKIAAIRKVSPSENMFEYLRRTRPDLTIEEFCEKLDMAKAFKPLRSIRSAIKGKVLQNKDLVSQLADKDLTLKNNLILQLDAQTFWRGLAKQFNIPEKKCSTFLRDPDCNLTRKFFLILNTQSPELKVSKLKTYLEDLLEGKEMLKELSKISGERDLKCLNSEAALMCDVIEPMLNSPQSRLLYKLAEKFKKDGYLRDIDIDEFEATESYESATAKLMEYILTSREEIYKIRDLKDCLVEIERNDCCNIIMKYVEAEAGTAENEGHANKENGNKTDIPISVSETATKETNGDKTDSPVVVSGEAGTENKGHANKENGNKTDILIAVSETPTKETNGDKTDIPVVVSGINQNKESYESKKVYEKTTSSSSNKQPIFEAQCIKNKRLGEARQTALLFNKLKILLDPQKPLGGDYRGLADKFGYTYDEICFFGSQPSPTVALLQEQMHKCTFQTLRKYLNDMERHDAVDKIDEYIKQQGCNCHKCCSIR